MGTLASRRYYDDSYCSEFSARVIEATDHGGRPAVALEETFFYPSSGGQPYDTGWLGDRRVIDVVVREGDGAVLHILDGEGGLGTVAGRIDWERRFDHMQQHSGQHILSQAFLRVAAAPTVGFHLGADYVSIDVETTGLDEGKLGRAFELANEVIDRDLVIRSWFPTEAELAALSLRKTPDVDGALRVVSIGDFDQSACGGTHVARTAQVGLIHCIKSERYKSGLRVSFHCGGRARRDYGAKQRIAADLSMALTCSVPELTDAVRRLQGDLQEARRALAKYHDADLDREAAALLASATDHEGRRVVQRAFDRRAAEDLKGLGLRLTATPGVVALLGTGGDRAQFVLARSEDLVLDLRPALQAALAVVGGGKGGGARIVQGGGGADVAVVTVEAALDAAAITLGPAKA